MTEAEGLDWEACRVFFSVARAQSFSAAAKELGLSQPTVGRRVAALEEALGARLVVRRARGLVLTLDGEALLADVRRMDEAFSGALRRARHGSAAKDEAPIRISASEGLALHLARRLVDHRDLRVELVVDNLTVDLARRQADIGVRLYRPDQPDLVTRKVGTLRFGLYASPGYLAARGTPRKLSELEGHDLIRFAGANVPPYERWLAERTAGASSRLSATSLVAQHEAARAGWGISAGSCVVLGPDPALRRVVPKASLPSMEVWLTAHADVKKSPRVSRAWGILSEVLSLDLKGDPADAIRTGE